MKIYGLSKKERLNNKKLITKLFETGSHFTHPPFKIFWQVETLKQPLPAQILISVPKKKFPKAFMRNRIKRLIREAYRLHKPEIYKVLNEKEIQCTIGILYIHHKALPFKDINTTLQDVFKVWGEKVRNI